MAMPVQPIKNTDEKR